MSVAVLIPWRGGCPDRERALRWVSAQHEHPVTICEPPDGEWCKAHAVNPAAQASSADIIVVADADVWTDGIPAATEAVKQGAPWAIPHRTVHRLTPAATDRLIDGRRDKLGTVERPYTGVPGGGVVVIPRALLIDVPLDPRFIGWGQEDVSWSAALTTLAGRPWRGTAPMWHLWHPPQPRVSRKTGTRDGQRLHLRYHAARHKPDQMRALIEEARA